MNEVQIRKNEIHFSLGSRDCKACGSSRSMVKSNEVVKNFHGIEYKFEGYVCTKCEQLEIVQVNRR